MRDEGKMAPSLLLFVPPRRERECLSGKMKHGKRLAIYVAVEGSLGGDVGAGKEWRSTDLWERPGSRLSAGTGSMETSQVEANKWLGFRSPLPPTVPPTAYAHFPSD